MAYAKPKIIAQNKNSDMTYSYVCPGGNGPNGTQGCCDAKN
jgi:hypothetical protein